MMWGRRDKLRAALTPALERDERVVSWAAVGTDQAVVATNRGLWLPAAESRIGWHEINKATWGDDSVLRIVASSIVPTSGTGDFSVVSDLPVVSVTLTEPRDLPRRVRQRVTSSVPYSSRHPLPDGGTALVVGRRVPGRDGLSWFVRYEDQVDPADPEVVKATDGLVAEAKASTSQAD